MKRYCHIFLTMKNALETCFYSSKVFEVPVLYLQWIEKKEKDTEPYFIIF